MLGTGRKTATLDEKKTEPRTTDQDEWEEWAAGVDAEEAVEDCGVWPSWEEVQRDAQLLDDLRNILQS